MKAFTTALLLLALLPAAAAAKSGIMMDSTPTAMVAGEPWDASFQIVRDDVALQPTAGVQPYIRIISSDNGASFKYPARKSHDGLWRARVVFPKAGDWSYSVEGFGPLDERQYFDTVNVAPRASRQPAVLAASSGGGSFPWGWTAAAAALVLVAGLLALRRRGLG
jgi:hypothetical protein